ncbi:hypothetical protein [Psychroserpens luteolus]|uniref:hypothetical protein n=1 Tax=Psychroserpens luteolus TaxID=2855840 RepID=UPI001E40A2FD|nr:hypothetical protein [Psychroserpens luteolus]MCD2260798.1 hypothetical protein [Psychroserpens luteolus]
MLIVFSCSTKIETCILPDNYIKTVVAQNESIYPYFFEVYSLETEKINEVQLREYPKCDFNEIKYRNYDVVKWTSFNEIDEESTYLIDHLNTYNSETYKNVIISELNMQISRDKSGFYFSGFYTKIDNSKLTTRSYDYFFILDKKEKKIYEFIVDE